MVWILTALATYAALPSALWVLGLGSPETLAVELLALAILLTAARLAIVLANSALILFFPIALLAAVSGQLAAIELGLIGPWGRIIEAIMAIIAAICLNGAAVSLTRNWREPAKAGLSLALGILAMNLAAGYAPPAAPPENWAALIPALIAGSAAALLGLIFGRSAAYSAILEARRNPKWTSPAGVPLEDLSRQLLLITGLFAGLAAIPVMNLDWAQSPERWPSLWLGMTVVVILSGRNGLADTLFMGLLILVTPWLLMLWLPGLPDLTLLFAFLALVVSTAAFRGLRPGEQRAQEMDI